MSLLSLFIVSILCAATVVYLITYIPIKSTIFGKNFSPRLVFLKFLPLIDVIVTISLILVPMFTGISGIGVFIASAFTAAGLSAGVVFVFKVMKPRWIAQYQRKCSESFSIC